MIYRLLAMNIDETILHGNGKLDKSVKDGVQYVQDRGVIVTLYTSRNFIFAKRIAKALKIKAMVIAHHGSFIASTVDQAIFVKRIQEEIVPELVRTLETFACHIRVVHERYSVSNKPVAENPLLGKAVIDANSFSVYHHHFVQNLSQYVIEKQVNPTHIEALFTDKDEADMAYSRVAAEFSGVDVYSYGNQLIILPKGISKLSGLMYAADFWGVKMRETVAIGSGMDDLEVIGAAGLGVAMGNAPKKLKRAADWVTRTNENQGVHFFIMEHFRKQQSIDFLEKFRGIRK